MIIKISKNIVSLVFFFTRIYFHELAIFRFCANTYLRELPFRKFFTKSFFLNFAHAQMFQILSTEMQESV